MIWLKPENRECLKALLPYQWHECAHDYRYEAHQIIWRKSKRADKSKWDVGNPTNYEAECVLDRLARVWLEARRVHVQPGGEGGYVAKRVSQGTSWHYYEIESAATYAECQLKAMIKLLEGAK